MKASSGVPAADGEMLKSCATIGIPQTPDSVVTTAKCEAKLIATPQFAVEPRAWQLASSTLLKVLLLCGPAAGLTVSDATARVATPTQAMKTKQARQPKPLIAAASGVVANTPPT